MNADANMAEPFRAAARAPWTEVDEHYLAALDGRFIQIRGEVYPLRIEGIHHDGDEVWIQIAPIGAADHGVLIHCSTTQSVDELLARLSVHLRNSTPPHLLDTHPVSHPRPLP